MEDQSNDASPDEVTPAVRIGDAERDRAIRRLERAMAEGHITFEEMESRMALAHRAKTEDDLAPLLADLPERTDTAPEPTSRLGGTEINVIGDIRRGGWMSVPSDARAISIIGDITIDLSSAALPPGGVDLTLFSLIGDVTVIVPDGIPVEVNAVAVIGDRIEAILPPTSPGPVVRIKGVVVIGDFRVLAVSRVPEGRLRVWWAAVRRRAVGQN